MKTKNSKGSKTNVTMEKNRDDKKNGKGSKVNIIPLMKANKPLKEKTDPIM